MCFSIFCFFTHNSDGICKHKRWIERFLLLLKYTCIYQMKHGCKEHNQKWKFLKKHLYHRDQPLTYYCPGALKHFQHYADCPKANICKTLCIMHYTKHYALCIIQNIMQVQKLMYMQTRTLVRMVGE